MKKSIGYAVITTEEYKELIEDNINTSLDMNSLSIYKRDKK